MKPGGEIKKPNKKGKHTKYQVSAANNKKRLQCGGDFRVGVVVRWREGSLLIVVRLQWKHRLHFFCHCSIDTSSDKTLILNTHEIHLYFCPKLKFWLHHQRNVNCFSLYSPVIRRVEPTIDILKIEAIE